MGYTVSKTDVLIGLGVSAISDCKTAYAQNAKVVESYQDRVNSRRDSAVFRGHFLSERDQITRDTILQLICNHQTYLPQDLLSNLSPISRKELSTMAQEGLVEVSGHLVQVTELGKPFIRNICSVFDAFLQAPLDSEQLFSKAI